MSVLVSSKIAQGVVFRRAPRPKVILPLASYYFTNGAIEHLSKYVEQQKSSRLS